MIRKRVEDTQLAEITASTSIRLTDSTVPVEAIVGTVEPSHLSEMLTLPPQTLLSLIASERRDARSAINTIQAERSVVL